jgi:hypothetical protein
LAFHPSFTLGFPQQGPAFYADTLGASRLPREIIADEGHLVGPSRNHGTQKKPSQGTVSCNSPSEHPRQNFPWLDYLRCAHHGTEHRERKENDAEWLILKPLQWAEVGHQGEGRRHAAHRTRHSRGRKDCTCAQPELLMGTDA